MLGAALLAGAALCLAGGCGDNGGSGPQDGGGGPTIEQFVGAEECGTCHPAHYAEWRGSMHAYAFVDPVRTRINDLEMAATGGALGRFCVGCHSPIGFVTGAADGHTAPSSLPPIVQEGVTCEACHQEIGFHPADETGGHPHIAPGRTVFGPFDDAVETPAHASEQNVLFERSVSCMPCHNFVARGVPLEPTYDEWNQSSYAVRLECQDCHMDTYTGQAAVGGPVRENLTRHDFIGVDVAMVDFPFRDYQRGRVEALLKNAASLFVEAPPSAAAGETLTVRARVANDRTGHNLPSGVSFARQVWLEVIVRDDVGDTVFVSGDVDANGDLRDAHSELDPGGDAQLKIWTTDVTFVGADPGITVFVGTGITGEMIPPEETRGQDYRVAIPPSAQGTLHLSVRLLFRGFKPYSLRGAGLEALLGENPIFEMNRYEGDVSISG
jgi:hypothetical protein